MKRKCIHTVPLCDLEAKLAEKFIISLCTVTRIISLILTDIHQFQCFAEFVLADVSQLLDSLPDVGQRQKLAADAGVEAGVVLKRHDQLPTTGHVLLEHL